MDKYINSLSKEEQIDAITKISNVIQYIKDPCLDIQLAAVNKFGYSIKYIKNPYLEVQLVAVRHHGINIQHIENPGYEVQQISIQQNYNKEYFEYIKPYITYPDLLELLELKILSADTSNDINIWALI